MRFSIALGEAPVRPTDPAFDERLARSVLVAVDRELAIAQADPSDPELASGDVAIGGILELLRDGAVVAWCPDALGFGSPRPLIWTDPHARESAGSPGVGIPETIEWLDFGDTLRSTSARGRWQIRLTGELRAALVAELLRAADAAPGKPWRWATRWWAGSVTVDLHDAGLDRPAVSQAALEKIRRARDTGSMQPSPPEVAAFMAPTPGELRGFLFE